MTKEEKKEAIDKLTGLLAESKNVYLADISGMDADQTSKLRRLCFSKGVQIQVVKNGNWRHHSIIKDPKLLAPPNK